MSYEQSGDLDENNSKKTAKHASRSMIENISFYWNGAPGKIRTPDPQIRSLVLYPAELPVLTAQSRCRAGGLTSPGGQMQALF